MTRNLRYLFVLLFLGVAQVAIAQTGAISGTVKEKKTNEAVIGAVVEVFQAGTIRGGAVTDEDGKYFIKPLNPANDYEVRVRYQTFREIRLRGLLISPDKTTYQNFSMEENTTELKGVVIKEYKNPLIKKDEPGTSTTITSEQIEKLPTRQTSDAASLAGGSYQQKSGAAVSIAGARSNGTLYIVDGVQVNGASGTNFPPNSIDQISVLTSGIPAKYGDATGGVISITTKGPKAKPEGSVGFERSVDGYGHNLAYFNIGGPIVKKVIDKEKDLKKSILGYTLSGQYLYDLDNNPSYIPNYVLKSDVLKRLQQNPLVLTTTSSGAPVLRYGSEYIRMSDMETSKARVNADYKNARLVGKFDYQINDQMNIVFGGNASYITQKNYSRSYTLMSPEGIPTANSLTGRGFVRFTQRFGKSIKSMEDEESKNAKTPLISNAFYTLQADYQVDYSSQEDPNHKRNAFNYGYVGKFDVITRPFYQAGVDDSTGKTVNRLYTYDFPVGVNFTRSELNPILANYTSQLYNYLGDNRPLTLSSVYQANGLRNGDFPGSVYGLWQNVGNSLTGFGYSNSEQFAFNVDASFDLQPKKTRHQIEFGLYYQQRAERSYSVNAAGLWNQARLLTNKHLTNLDATNPIYIINGQRYTLQDVRNGVVVLGPNDTVIYERQVDTASQSTFDYNLRKKLGLDVYGRDYLNVDNMDPSTFSLSMFSADELINQGNPIASYQGYDYAGNRLNGQVNFNDWFTKKDANGNYTRQIGAFRPNYIAGYIMDKFELPNNALFHLGLRVERFDANTKVLKDPYSLYASHTVATSLAENKLNGKTPENIGSDYVVYVSDNSSSSPTVIGYRNGDDWYDPYGKYISDPTLLKNYSGGRDPQPELVKTGGTRAYTMKDSAYNPNTSFTDYTPQVNLMPRISFTFPIAEKAMFYAHYDVLVQRPKSVGEIFASPIDYYYINQNSNSIIANPNLKPEKLFDYELGFQQELTRHSAITITAFYKERKDMIQVRPYLYAWPNTYFTYGNRDFSTTKGFILKYDLRRINHISMLLSYTLQFAEGTGSSSSSSNGGSGGYVGAQGLMQSLISAQLPNLRFGFPLDIDSRHNFNANIDYRYEKGEGPVVGKHHILENAGLNLVFRTRSGEPYTRYEFPGQRVVAGGVQGSRLPWHYWMDLRIDKAFELNMGKKVDRAGVPTSRYGITAFVYITNLLDTKDILGVYGFTGRPDDDGWLTSAQGIQEASIKVSPESYKDLYSLSRNSPGLLNNARRINLGIQFNF